MYNLWDTSGGIPEPETRTAMMHHSMMQMCRLDFPPFKMQASLPGQMYAGHNQFEGILELRKEKSRDAARSRRGKENYEFYELAKMLPLPGAITSQLDKASIVRLTIANLKLKDFSCHGDPPWQRDGPASSKHSKGGASRRRSITNYATEVFETHQGTHILQSLDGFGFTLSNDGRFLYISETVSIYLGLSQVEMTGSTIFDYVHPADQQELAEQLGLSTSHHHPTTRPSSPCPADEDDEGSSSSTPRAASPTLSTERGSIMAPSPSAGLDRSFCIRMKSTLTKRGVHIKSSGYRVVQILAHMRPQYSFSLARKHPPPILGLVAIAIALPPPTITELFIDNDMFVSRLSPAFTVTYVEPRIGDLMDLGADDLTNENLYSHCHAQDLHALRKAHQDLLSKGQVMTDYYRLMNKHGGFVWLQTCATVLHNPKAPDEQNIIAINYVLSGVEYPGCVMDTRQLQTVTHPGGDQSDHSENEHGHTRDHFKQDPTPSPPDHGTPHGPLKPHEGNLGQTRHQHFSASSHLPGVLETASGPVTSDLATSVTTVNQLLDFESIPPITNGGPDLFSRNSPQDSPDNVDTNMNTLYSEEERISNGDANCKLDSKNSRRKMDKPRKRKRDSIDNDDEPNIFQQPNMKNSACALSETTPVTTLPSSMLSGTETKTGSFCGVSGSCTSSIRPDSVHSTITPTSPNAVTPKSVSTPIPEDLTVQITSPAAAVTSPGVSTPSSVQIPLTPRMNGVATDSDRWPIESACTNVSSFNPDVVSSNSSSVRDLEEVMNKHLPVSAQMDAELRNEYAQSFLGGFGKHKSTIQWVGSNNSDTSPDMTASNLLRSLYANRETVIRTNVYNPRPQYYSDMQTSLLTPPGATTDPYKDSFQVIAAHSKNQPATYTGLSYPTNSLSVSMPAGIPEGFNMTPPSSVSPHEKYQSSLGEQMHYGSDAMPLKPQAYPLPAHVNSSLGAFERTGTNQYVPYYGNGPGIPSYGHTVHYREPTKNGAW